MDDEDGQRPVLTFNDVSFDGLGEDGLRGPSRGVRGCGQTTP